MFWGGDNKVDFFFKSFGLWVVVYIICDEDG